MVTTSTHVALKVCLKRITICPSKNKIMKYMEPKEFQRHMGTSKNNLFKKLTLSHANNEYKEIQCLIELSFRNVKN